MSRSAQGKLAPIAGVADLDDLEPPTCADFAQAAQGKMAKMPENLAAAARIVPLDVGLYTIEIGRSAGLLGQVGGLQLPILQFSAPNHGRDRPAEIIDASGIGEIWVGPEGGTVIVRSPPGGGRILATAYGLPGQVVAFPHMEIHRVDRSRRDGPLLLPADERGEVRTEIVLHIERTGDRCFPGQGWVGNRGKKLRIEAFSIRPIDVLLARDIEFKALGPQGRETPWVTDAKLCGTRGQGLPLTGFAVRLTRQAAKRFDVIYEGAYFESGVVGPKRNGELCIPSIADDPLEAMKVRLVAQAGA